MTSPEAAARYEADHKAMWRDKRWAVYNPNNLPESELPVIYGFNNGGQRNFLSAELLAQDGTHMGSHFCSSEGFMPSDLGILEGSAPDRHEEFKKHYPNGYRMEFVGEDAVRHHPGLLAAYALNQKQPQPVS